MAARVDTAELLAAAKKYFGYSQLRDFQLQAIRASLEHRDSCVVVATGAGKSLCYQMPPLLSGRVSVVISPLISLMEDQVSRLTQQGVRACHLAGHQQASVFEAAKRGKFLVVFLTPERAMTWLGALRELHRTTGEKPAWLCLTVLKALVCSPWTRHTACPSGAMSSDQSIASSTN